MPRPNKRQEDPGFTPVRCASEEFHLQKNTTRDTRRDCAVKAIALLCNQPYDAVWDACAKHGRKTGRGTPWPVIDAVLADYGFKRVDRTTKLQLKIRRAMPEGHRDIGNLTTYHARRFPEAWTDLPPLMIGVRRHVAAFYKGDVHDWSAGNRKHIQALYVLEPMGQG